MSLLNKELYAPRWLWDRAKEVDEWAETNPGDNEGTSVRAGAQILMQLGHCDWLDEYADDEVEERRGYKPDSGDGIAAVRWTDSVDEVHAALGNERADQLGAVPFVNSWGRNYPYRTWMPDEVLAFLIDRQGEVAVPTDRLPATPSVPAPNRPGNEGAGVRLRACARSRSRSSSSCSSAATPRRPTGPTRSIPTTGA